MAARIEIKTKNKYRARPTKAGGVMFRSKHEADRYSQLLLMQQHGVIKDLELQPEFSIDVVGHDGKTYHIGLYHADFRFYDIERRCQVIEDAKSDPTRTTDYKLRKLLVEALHGITIVEV